MRRLDDRSSETREKKKVKRIVDLDHNQIMEEDEEDGRTHSQEPTSDSKVDEDDDAKTPTASNGHGHARHHTEIISSSYRDTSLPTFAPITRPAPRRQATNPLPESPSLPTHPSRSSNSSFNLTSSSRSNTTLSPPALPGTLSSIGTRPSPARSSTIASRSAKRAARVSASMFEPSSANPGGSGGERFEADGEALRRKIEALKREMGDGWLGVFSQSQVT